VIAVFTSIGHRFGIVAVVLAAAALAACSSVTVPSRSVAPSSAPASIAPSSATSPSTIATIPSPTPVQPPPTTGPQFGIDCGDVARRDCNGVIGALMGTQRKYGAIRQNIVLDGYSCGTGPTCEGPQTMRGLRFVAGAHVNYDDKPTFACWNVWLPKAGSQVKPFLELYANDVPGCWPSELVPSAAP